MKILGISGTKRVNGNSSILLESALAPFIEKNWEVKKVFLKDYRLESCRGCEACRKLSKCVINDDFSVITELFNWTDALIISSPVYYRNINSHLMMLLERYYSVSSKNLLKDKVGGAISVGRGAGRANSLNNIYTWMLSSGMICVPGELNGVTAIASEPNDIFSKPEYQEQARILGKNIMETTSKLLAVSRA
ncbi:MAG: flavodoxin family protein [Deltaproteobacteria bacterium]|nr:flavodoxin family protein [Deltaproteobacteria bacterium]